MLYSYSTVHLCDATVIFIQDSAFLFFLFSCGAGSVQTLDSSSKFSNLFKKAKVRKEYLAICHGDPGYDSVVDAPLYRRSSGKVGAVNKSQAEKFGAKAAVTRIRNVATAAGGIASLLSAHTTVVALSTPEQLPRTNIVVRGDGVNFFVPFWTAKLGLCNVRMVVSRPWFPARSYRSCRGCTFSNV